MKITFYVNNRKKSFLRLLLFTFGYLKFFFLRKYYYDLTNFFKLIKYSGHIVVVECLDIGSKELGIDYKFYKNDFKFSKIAVVNSGIENLRFCIEQKKNNKISFIVAGPNLVITPNDHNSILSHELIDLVITPSKWVSNFYSNLQPSLKNRISEWYSGVDHKYWTDSRLRRNYITFYIKESNGPIINIDEYIKAANDYNYEIKLIKYNKYNNKEFKNILNKSLFLIYFVNQESQGLATAEAWSCNTPTLIWNNKKTNISGYDIESSCCPYLDSSCGDFFDNLNDFKNKLNSGIEKYKNYKPREWVLENMTYKISVKNLINLIKSKI